MTYNFYALKKVLIIVLEFDFEGKHLYFSSVDIRSFFMKNTSLVLQNIIFWQEKRRIIFANAKKKTLDIFTHVKVKILSAYARLNSIYKYIIRSKYLVKSYANIFLFLLAQMTKPSDNIYTTVRSLKSI